MIYRPLIGIVPLVDKDQGIRMDQTYIDAIEKSGGIPLIFPLTKDREIISQLAGICSGFLFTGGEDLQPDLYKEKPLNDTLKTKPARDFLEADLFRQALVRDKSILGICRGHQLINVVLGGSLYQDLPSQKPSQIVHRQSEPYDKPVHTVFILDDTPLKAVTSKDTLEVNSIHHQGIKELSNRLKPMAYSKDGLVEAAYMPDHNFVWSIQWHPEKGLDWQSSRQIFTSFISSCRGKCTTKR